MRNRRILCAVTALVLCLLTAAAAFADGGGYFYAAVDISQAGVRPYDWEVEKRGDSAIGWNIGNLFDGKWSTVMGFVCWNKQATNDIPDISLYFANATIREIWLRNGFQGDNLLDYARIRQLDVTVWSGETQLYFNKFRPLVDSVDTAERSATMYDGYQCLDLKQQFQNVTRVDLVIHGWYEGGVKESQYKLQISDMIFLPDKLQNIYGSGIFSYDYNYNYNYNYNTPTQAPAQNPYPVVTAAPNQGLTVTANQRIATRSGPGTQYNGTGSYFQAGTQVKALTAAYDKGNGIWWIQIELTYTGEKRRVYTGVKRLNMTADQVPAEENPVGVSLTITEAYGCYGPGYGYAMTGNKIPSGTPGTIWAIEADYAQFEYYDAKNTLHREWIPLSALQYEDDAQG